MIIRSGILLERVLMRPFYIAFLLIELLCGGRDSIILQCKKAPFLSVYVGNVITKDQCHARQERSNKEANMIIKSI